MLEGLTKASASPISEFASKSLPCALTGEGNECFSPLSLYMALSSVALGADGESLRELLEVLGASSASELKRSCQRAYRLLCPPPKPKREPKDGRGASAPCS